MASWNPGDVEQAKKFVSLKYGGIHECRTSEEATYSCKDTAVYPIERFRTTFNNYYEFLAVFTLTYEDMVLLCWFAGDRIPCTNNDRYFNFALTDLGSCFSFNEIRKPPSQSGILDKLPSTNLAFLIIQICH
uniref:Uncharacterized protein n=1 Tax=Romanomermis culicivorax TaxID=13658 RepID=A0A915JY49_ROMCU